MFYLKEFEVGKIGVRSQMLELCLVSLICMIKVPRIASSDNKVNTYSLISYPQERQQEQLWYKIYLRN